MITDDEHPTPKDAFDMVKAIPNTELWVILVKKHMFPQEGADALNKRIIWFLKRKPSVNRQGAITSWRCHVQ
jgi:pimeloyl-ACP methyl ester carboxylesterase